MIDFGKSDNKNDLKIHVRLKALSDFEIPVK